MKADEEKLIDYLMNDLPLEEKLEVDRLIRQDPEWQSEFSRLQPVMQTLTDEDLRSIDPPFNYWNGFVPRLHERMERRRKKRDVVRKRLYYAVPAVGFAALLLFFTHTVQDTNKKIDYLLDNSVSSASETFHSNGDLNDQIDVYFKDNTPDPLKELTSGAETLDVTYELKDLSTEEKDELLSALETTSNI